MKTGSWHGWAVSEALPCEVLGDINFQRKIPEYMTDDNGIDKFVTQTNMSEVCEVFERSSIYGFYNAKLYKWIAGESIPCVHKDIYKVI